MLLGPAIVVSFLLACIVVTLSAMSFTEFATRVSKTGSTYLYMYMTLGELTAFLAGWIALTSKFWIIFLRATLLIYVAIHTIFVAVICGGATNGRAWSAYFDSLFSKQISNFTETNVVHWTIGAPVSEYPDFIASGVLLVMTAVVAFGANFSVTFSSFFVAINVCVLLFCIVVGFVFGDIGNWTNPETGGFFPFGVSGVLRGSAACFWAFTGFEILSSSVEEAEQPQRSIPIATASALSITTLLYIGTAAALTFVAPYASLDDAAPLPSAFAARDLTWARYIVSVGPLCGLTSTLFSSLYGFVRISYAMAEDGLLFSFFHDVNTYTGVPVLGTLTGGIIMATIACFLDINQIISFGIIATLSQYALVSACVIILRYRPDSRLHNQLTPVAAALPSDADLNAPKNMTPLFQWKMTKLRSSLRSSGHDGSMTNLLEHENESDCDVTEEQQQNGESREVLNSSFTSDNVDHFDSVSQTSVDIENDVRRIESEAGKLKPAFHWLSCCVGRLATHPGACVCLCMLLLTLCLVLIALILVYGAVIFHSHTNLAFVFLSALVAMTSFLLFVIFAHRHSLFPTTLKVQVV